MLHFENFTFFRSKLRSEVGPRVDNQTSDGELPYLTELLYITAFKSN